MLTPSTGSSVHFIAPYIIYSGLAPGAICRALPCSPSHPISSSLPLLSTLASSPSSSSTGVRHSGGYYHLGSPPASLGLAALASSLRVEFGSCLAAMVCILVPLFSLPPCLTMSRIPHCQAMSSPFRRSCKKYFTGDAAKLRAYIRRLRIAQACYINVI